MRLSRSSVVDGSLTPNGMYSTGGNGTGAGLGSGHSIAVSDDGHEVVVVNAGSNTVSAFHVRHDRLELQGAPVGPDRTEVRATLLVKD